MGPLGPGNPLAASMRAAREHLLRNRNTDARESGEPYPLLLIRPDGIGAYYVARAALTSWGSEFGYEFVDQEWKLEYPPVDPELLAITKAAAEDARQRQRLLARAAPKIYEAAEAGGTYFRASPSTGGVMVDGRSTPRSAASRRGAGARGAGARGASGRGASEEESPLADHDGPLGSGGFPRSGSAAKPGSNGTPGSAAGAGEQSAGGASEGAPEVQLTSRGAKDASKGQAGEPLRPGQYMPKPPQSMAAQRGKDWGLRDTGPSAVPISRKIRVRCQADQLAILSDDRGVKNEQVVALGERTEDSVEELVSRVWDHMDRWGIAGTNMYWKPQLLFETTPESQARYEEIKALLEGSGLDVAQKSKANTAQIKARQPK